MAVSSGVVGAAASAGGAGAADAAGKAVLAETTAAGIQAMQQEAMQTILNEKLKVGMNAADISAK
jgi:hypothetical protein